MRGSLLHNFILIKLDVKSTEKIHHGECNVDHVKYESMKFSKPVEMNWLVRVNRGRHSICDVPVPGHYL